MLSQPLLDELSGILGHRFRWPAEAILVELDTIVANGFIVLPTQTVNVRRDPDDNRVLECAIAGDADFLITGDHDLLSLDSFSGVRILTVRQFLDSLPSALQSSERLR